MHGASTILGLIPARSGSKGLPNKNILSCAGKPLIEWTIAAAQAVDVIDEVVVSTDSDDIAAIARSVGASVPFLRPEVLAADDSSLVDAVEHAWKSLRTSSGALYDYIVVLQPTSPLRSGVHIRQAIELYFEKRRYRTSTLAAVCKVSPKYGWLLRKSRPGGSLRFCFEVNGRNPQRQNLDDYFLPNGAIFIIKGGEFSEGFYGEDAIPYLMDPKVSVDIDSIEDFRVAEKILLEQSR